MRGNSPHPINFFLPECDSTLFCAHNIYTRLFHFQNPLLQLEKNILLISKADCIQKMFQKSKATNCRNYYFISNIMHRSGINMAACGLVLHLHLEFIQIEITWRIQIEVNSCPAWSAHIKKQGKNLYSQSF